MQYPDSQLCELAILNKLAQVRQSILLGVGHKLDQVKHTLHNGALELVTALVAQDPAEELQHGGLLAGKLET